jgi:Ca-activated chloride channel family protein
VAAVSAGLPAWRRRIPALLLAVAALALAIALARPQATVAVPIEQATVLLVVDTSRSMLAEDVDPTRLEAARGAARRFLDRVPDELRVGLVAFSTAPHTVEEPTLDRERIRATIDALEADGGTATGDALDAALEQLERAGSDGARRPPAAVVLLSDGRATDGQDPVEVARRAADLRVPIHTVALGTPEGTVAAGPFGERVAVPPDPETLQEIAEVSRGDAFEVDDADELDRIYERLGSEVGTRPEEREVTAAFAAAGLLLLAGAAGTAVRWRGRLP